MTGLTVVGAILLVLIGIGLIPVGVDVAWKDGELSAAARIGFIGIRLGGTSGKKEEKKAGDKPEKYGKKKNLPPLSLLRISARHGYRTLCRLLSRLRVELLRIHVVSAFPDPAETAAVYAAVCVALEGLLRVGGRRLMHPDFLANVDFDSDEPALDFRIRLTIRICRILGAVLDFGSGFLKDYIRYRKVSKPNGKSSDR